MNKWISKNIKQGSKSPFQIYDLPDNYFIRYEKKMTIALGIAICALISSIILWIIAMNMS
jgi:hypothetical protein